MSILQTRLTAGRMLSIILAPLDLPVGCAAQADKVSNSSRKIMDDSSHDDEAKREWQDYARPSAAIWTGR